MTKIGVVKSVDQFYDILYAKYKEYLYRLVSTKKMLEKLNITIETKQDIIDNMENIRKMSEDTTYMTYSMEDIRARKKMQF